MGMLETPGKLRDEANVPYMLQCGEVCPGVLLNNTEIPWVLGGDTGLPVVLEGSHGCSGC